MPAACSFNSTTRAAGSCAETVWKLAPEDFGATQHTPIFHDGHIFGTRPNGQFVCLGLDGKVIWASPAGDDFGLGPFLFADGIFFVMNDSGKLSLVEDSSDTLQSLGPGTGAPRPRVMGADGAGRRTIAGARLHAPGLFGRFGAFAIQINNADLSEIIMEINDLQKTSLDNQRLAPNTLETSNLHGLVLNPALGIEHGHSPRIACMGTSCLLSVKSLEALVTMH